MTDTTEGKHDLGQQVVRTLVPVVAGLLLAQVARAGLDVPPDAVVGAVEAVAIAVYYTTFALLERRFPALGAFLGMIGAPQYPDVRGTLDRREDDGEG